MSYITNVLIQGAHTETIESLNTWLAEADTERSQQFQRIDMDAAGGYKVYTPKVWAAAFNYGPMGELLPKLRDPETWGVSVLLVSVVVDGEETNEAFTFDYVFDKDGSNRRIEPVSAQALRL
jgi:hypothetical protein